jgi:hypothetical protein
MECVQLQMKKNCKFRSSATSNWGPEGCLGTCRVCQGLQIPLAKGMAFVDEWEAENGGKWSETPAETASMSQHAAVEAGAERMGPGVAGGEFAHHRELAEIYADADDVIDDVESDTALPGLV